MRAPSDGSSSKKRQGRYELGELLGRGGMAEVFAGSSLGDHGFQKPVAIKRLLPELANDHVFVDRLIDEAKILVGMQHGNIVSVLDLAREGDDVFLVMEFVDGPSLRQLIKLRGQRGISFGLTTYVLSAAAAGLEFAHTRATGAIIHADISPSNLLLTTSGEVRVADFGIARKEGGAGYGVEGKWAYMAPEQARGEKLAPAADVFAMGVVMYELLTGKHPFGRQVTADDRAESLRITPPRIVRRDVPAGLDTICMTCLAIDPRARYPRMSDLIGALTDERYANRYREGASELAATIREVAPALPQAPIVAQRTQTDRPAANAGDRGHTIVTRSLLSQPRAAARAQQQQQPGEQTFAQGTAARGGTGELIAEAPPVRPIGTAQVRRVSASISSVVAGEPVAVAPAPKKSRWPLYIIGAAVLAGGGAALAITMGPDVAPTNYVAAPTVKQASAIVIPTVVPAPAPAPVETAPAPAPAPTIAEVAPAPTPAPVAPAPIKKVAPVIHHTEREHEPKLEAAAKSEGTIRLSTTTWAYASIDGGPQQEVSMVRKFTLPAGKHTVRVFNTDLGLKPVTRSFTIEPNSHHALKVDLETGSAKESE